MKKLNLILAKLGFFIFFVFNTFVQADELISKNISVIDGDTILLENKKIRFSGIDAPESFFRGKKQTCLLNSIKILCCLLYTSPSPRDVEESRMPSSA